MNFTNEQNWDAGTTDVWVMTDGTTGMKVQALALADELVRLRSDWKCSEFVVTPHRITRNLPKLASKFPSIPL